MAASSLLIVVWATGCAVAPPVPPDPELRRVATMYVERALRYPENPAVRAQAMEAAANVLGPEARLRIREGLKDEHPGVRFAACLALGKIRDASSMAAVRALVTSPDPNVRVGAYFALERMGDFSCRELWRDALRRHEDPGVRRNAALALGCLENKDAMPVLRAVASSDGDEGVRIQALEALALLGDQDAISRFIYDAYGSVGYKQPFALLTLGRVADPRAVGALRSRFDSSSYPTTRLVAARGLAMHGYDEGYQFALGSLSWNQPDEGLPDDPPGNQIMRVRSLAALTLGEIGDRRALGWLKLRMEEPDDPRVQLAAATAILMILNATPIEESAQR